MKKKKPFKIIIDICILSEAADYNRTETSDQVKIPPNRSLECHQCSENR